MKIEIDQYLSGELDILKNATKEKPVIAVIKSVVLRKKEELPFDSDEDKYELSLEIKGTDYTWTANKTSLRNMASKLGNNSEDWIGKEITLWVTEQQVGKKTRKIVWGAPFQKTNKTKEANAEEIDIEEVPF